MIREPAARPKAEEPLAGPPETGRAAEDRSSEVATARLKGAAYRGWSRIGLAEADFAYPCGSAEPVGGRVRTRQGTGGGFPPCSEAAGEDGLPARAAAGRARPDPPRPRRRSGL
ncbi:hypothetical protein [Streptomyces sp. YIM B13518]|uniref:hypothetical protein n=1 Tax=Streptomyces sp. YIM B13518 TaxID=3366316 RepID=UPI0036C02E07